jgi:hypothetical protein
VFPRGQRPPWGISLADIVFDYYQNNGVTRFNAIFYGNDSEKVGPIRSARLLDAHLIKMYKAIFIFGSADWRILERLRGGDFSDRIIMEKWGICPPLCRIDPEGYNYLMVNTKELSEFVDDNKIRDERQNLDGMSFNPSPPETSLSGQQAFVRISYAAYNRWDYDETSQRYLRYQDMIEALAGEEELAPMLDGINNEQISAANVVILLTTYKYAYQSKAGANEVFDIRLNGTGEAVAFRDGNAYLVNWLRDENNTVLYLTFPDGTPYTFKPGNTWFQVIGRTSKVESSENGNWRFDFSVP